MTTSAGVRGRARSRSPAPTPAAAPGSRPTSRRSARSACYGMTAITAVTVQNTKGVYGYDAHGPEARRRTDPRGRDATSASTRPRPGCWRTRAIVAAVADGRRGAGDPEPGRRSGVRLASTGTCCCADDAVAELRVADPAARDARHAEPPGGERARRRRRRGEGRHAPGGRRDPGARGGRGAGQGRPPRGVDRGRRPVRRPAGSRYGSTPTGSTRRTRTGPAARCRRRSRRTWRWDGSLLDAVRAGKAFVTEAIRHALATRRGDRAGRSAVVDPAGRAPVARGATAFAAGCA